MDTINCSLPKQVVHDLLVVLSYFYDTNPQLTKSAIGVMLNMLKDPCDEN